MEDKEKTELENYIIGSMIVREKYRFVDKGLIAEIVRDAFKCIKLANIERK